MAKSNDAFRTIGEVSDDLDVPKHVLRFWEGKFPQLKPMKRGGGRRFYRPEDVSLLRGIHHLLHAAGYTIKGVQRILRENGVEAVKAAAGGNAPEPLAEDAGEAPLAATKRRAKRGATIAARETGAAARADLSPAVRAQLTALLRDLRDCVELARGEAVGPSSAQGAQSAASKAKG